ncbi:uncharacterized protein LOC111043690 [Nilaparvata lugens]|uniref:uncharacterized protein LOC111043690 n=1 Tax=Nilaparvata lugens TaxID=108931 RepID=UPI00193D08A5|nr:uncharacterized protein LOC111043690 [Nilaparvata lugens]
MGTKIIGWILLSYHLFGISFTIYGYHLEMEIMSRYKAGSSDAIKHQEQIIIVMVIGAALTLSTIFDVILLIGAYTNWPKYLLTWIVMEVISVILSIFGVPGLMLEFPPFFGNIPGLSLVTTVYIILIVKSHHHNLLTIAKKTSPVVDA